MANRRDQCWRVGGFKPEHPSGNLWYENVHDDEAMTITYIEYDEAGRITIERPATDEDLHKFPLEGRNTFP